MDFVGDVNLLSPDRRDRTLARLTLLLFALGILWCCVKYALGTPVWGDEARLGLNLLDRSYADLTIPFAYAQVAPLGFLAGELTTFRFLGVSEWAIRLFPFLTGLLALALFWLLVRQLLNPLGTMIAVGTYAIGTYMARHAVEFKPYACDQLAAVALLLPAVLWLKEGRVRWLVLLALVVAPAVSISFPTCFVVAAIGAAILFPVLRTRRVANIAVFLLFGLLAGLSLVLAACATPASAPAIAWNRPFEPAAIVPVLRHDMAIANPPYPRPLYVDYLNVPTRFEFRPRHLIVEVPYNGTDQTEEVAADDGSYLENGVLYVDPSR